MTNSWVVPVGCKAGAIIFHHVRLAQIRLKALDICSMCRIKRTRRQALSLCSKKH